MLLNLALKLPNCTFIQTCTKGQPQTGSINSGEIKKSFTPIQNNSKIIVLYILIFKFLDSNLEDKDSAPDDSKHFLTSICS